jgi:hypothetical protein
MAICTYHLHDDPVAIPAVIHQIRPDYRIDAKDVEITELGRFTTKVLFFSR